MVLPEIWHFGLAGSAAGARAVLHANASTLRYHHQLHLQQANVTEDTFVMIWHCGLAGLEEENPKRYMQISDISLTILSIDTTSRHQLHRVHLQSPPTKSINSRSFTIR